MNGFQKTIAAVLLAAVLLFMIYLPKCAGKMLERDQYREWLEPEEEEFSGVINVWHVVRFKPYMGSVGAWLKKIADRAERRHFGVYFEVESISETEAEAKLQNGEFPDVISFPAGFLNGRELRIMNGTEIFGIDGTAVDFGDGYGVGELPAGFDGCRIVQLSDLHGKYFGKGNERLYSAVKAAQPEYIFVTGDLVDRKTENPTVYAGEVGAALSAIAPTYYVTGNHEWGHGTKVVEEIKRTLRESGVTVLSNEFVPLTRNGDSIVLAGIDDPNGYADQETPQQLAQEVYAKYGDPFWLLLAHRNNNFNGYYCRLGADLTFSGHAHGGIWRLPFTDGLVDTTLTLFPSFTSGFYHCTDENCEGAMVFVNRGLGNSPRVIPRILNRPQVAVITLERG